MTRFVGASPSGFGRGSSCPVGLTLVPSAFHSRQESTCSSDSLPRQTLDPFAEDGTRHPRASHCRRVISRPYDRTGSFVPRDIVTLRNLENSLCWLIL